ncbi:uncharacterized protein LOC116935148 [Daphnia magna]|uniref:uncharacterized protein LOC116935148 n=1 Tax=Daphnia magna TaxID=35525 RepID=UPI001E1BCA4D|nr:uncharacterized protein LOC116935148 [Daphnia magna]
MASNFANTVYISTIPFEDLGYYCCPIVECNYSTRFAKKLLSHLNIVHSKDKYFTSPCLHSPQCPHKAAFTSYSGLSKHLRKFHHSFFHGVVQVQPVQIERQGFVCETQTINDNGETHNEQTDNSTTGVNSQRDTINLQERCVEFVLKLLAEQKLNHVNVQYVTHQSKALISHCVNLKMAQVLSVLEENGIDSTCLNDVIQSHENPFIELQTQYSQNKFFVRQFRMILPQTITLPVGPKDYGRHRTGKSQHYKEKEYIYIPLLLQLEKYLNFADVSEAISKPKDNLSNIYAHFEDGLYFQGNIFFQSHPDALQLLVYIDECGMTGDRGNRSKKNKLVFVYGCLGNLERKHRSSFKSMFVISIFHNTVMTRFGLNVLLRPLVDDIKKLELGVNMSVGGKSTIVRGTLAAIVADNLASHQIGGFKVGFGKGFRKCRFCLGTSEDIKNKCFDNEFFPRTKIQHEQHCSSLHSEELRDHFQRTYGRD